MPTIVSRIARDLSGDIRQVEDPKEIITDSSSDLAVNSMPQPIFPQLMSRFAFLDQLVGHQIRLMQEPSDRSKRLAGDTLPTF